MVVQNPLSSHPRTPANTPTQTHNQSSSRPISTAVSRSGPVDVSESLVYEVGWTALCSVCGNEGGVSDGCSEGEAKFSIYWSDPCLWWWGVDHDWKNQILDTSGWNERLGLRDEGRGVELQLLLDGKSQLRWHLISTFSGRIRQYETRERNIFHLRSLRRGRSRSPHWMS